MTARHIKMATALIAALAVQWGVAVTPACADHDRRGERNEHHDRGWHGGGRHYYREREYYAPQPQVYYYYAPPAVYVPPPPRPSIGFDLFFPFRFH
jgi:hypothetical protein